MYVRWHHPRRYAEFKAFAVACLKRKCLRLNICTWHALASVRSPWCTKYILPNRNSLVVDSWQPPSVNLIIQHDEGVSGVVRYNIFTCSLAATSYLDEYMLIADACCVAAAAVACPLIRHTCPLSSRDASNECADRNPLVTNPLHGCADLCCTKLHQNLFMLKKKLCMLILLICPFIPVRRMPPWSRRCGRRWIT